MTIYRIFFLLFTHTHLLIILPFDHKIFSFIRQAIGLPYPCTRSSIQKCNFSFLRRLWNAPRRFLRQRFIIYFYVQYIQSWQFLVSPRLLQNSFVSLSLALSFFWTVKSRLANQSLRIATSCTRSEHYLFIYSSLEYFFLLRTRWKISN